MKLKFLFLLPLLACFVRAETDSDSVMRTMAKHDNPISNTDKDLLSSSVRATKTSIAREMLDSFYNDAVDYQHDHRYDEALELYEKILSIDPDYKDVQSRRETI